MDTNRLKSFAQRTRVELMGQVARRLEAALAEDSAERREAPAAMKALEDRIAREGERQVIEQVAYTWFNRFTALRYMDANGYLTPMVVAPAPDRTRPELLDQAVAGALPDHLRAPVADRVRDLLEGRAPAREPQVEAYRLLVVATCNHLGGVMPFLFERIADYTELLMPNELLAADGWVAEMRGVMIEEACQDVEIIGWLYQFYISEKKDQVFGRPSGQRIKPEEIPAATQLFTPHWIVRYLVENSLGRLWLLNRPGSRLAERMEYYIAPEEPETDFLRVTSPEEIRVCDPACGSGHMLTYAFDLLYAIYEEEGYDPVQIPELILRNNLTGIEIDDRAGALAAFALAMKAAAKIGRRRFLRMEVKPDVVVLENVEFTGQDRVGEFLRMIGEGANHDLAATLDQFGQAKNFGSLIVPKLKNPGEVLEKVRASELAEDIMWKGVWERVVAVLRMAEALAPRYHVVVANPPYMGSGGMNDQLNAFGRENFQDSRSDLFAMFLERSLMLSRASGYTAMINMQSWMFLSSFERLRTKLLTNCSIVGMAHLGERGFDSIGGAVVSTTAFSILNSRKRQHVGDYVRLVDGQSETEKSHLFKEAKTIERSDIIFRVPDELFKLVPGQAIAYWLSPEVLKLFDNEKLGERFESKEGVGTRNDEIFMKLQWEVSRSNVGRQARWIQSDKAGGARRWYMGFNFIMDWEDNGFRIKNYRNEDGSLRSRPQNTQFLFQSGVTWAKVSAGAHAFRWRPEGYGFNDAAPTLFGAKVFNVLGQLNSVVMKPLLAATGNTINISTGTLGGLPILNQSFLNASLQDNSEHLVALARSDWDAFETSWDFTTLPLLSPDHRSGTLATTYDHLRAHWAGMTAEMQRLEEENNRIFIDAYGLQDELTPEVPIEEITLTCNPAYSFKSEKTDEAREKRLLEQTMKEFISYAIGCMFGRYSLDAPGLILANQGDTIQTYLDRIPEPSFMPDRDNVIPLFEEDWFEDDAYQRFREFLSLTFGEDRLVENLEFMRQALGKEVRAYLAKDFYADHVQRYKKRPIYWLVSSPKGAFQALIYMHRYTPDTLNITLNDYVRALRDKLEAGMRAAKALEINPDASAAEKNRAKRDIDRFTKQIAEVTEWERDLLYPLAVERIRIDLDDGVKANYPQFPGVLKPIKGLEAKDA